MADINIDTTSAQYQQLLQGVDILRDVVTPRLKLFKKMPLAWKKQWLQRDPLLRKVLKLGLDLEAYLEKLREDDVT